MQAFPCQELEEKRKLVKAGVFKIKAEKQFSLVMEYINSLKYMIKVNEHFCWSLYFFNVLTPCVRIMEQYFHNKFMEMPSVEDVVNRGPSVKSSKYQYLVHFSQYPDMLYIFSENKKWLGDVDL